MRYAIIIEDDPKSGNVVVGAEGQEGGKRTSATKMFELILAATQAHFKPVKTWFRPIKGARK